MDKLSPPDYPAARIKAKRLATRPGVNSSLKTLGNAYLCMERTVQTFTDAMSHMCEGLDLDSDVFEAARQVKMERDDFANLKERLTAATTHGDLTRIVMGLEPPNLKPLENIDYQDLNPNVRATVRRLRSWGYETTDSGDGTSTIDCAVDQPMISINVATPTAMVAGVRDIYDRLRSAGVEMYAADRGVQGTVGGEDMSYTIQIYGVTDADFDEKATGTLVN